MPRPTRPGGKVLPNTSAIVADVGLAMMAGVRWLVWARPTCSTFSPRPPRPALPGLDSCGLQWGEPPIAPAGFSG